MSGMRVEVDQERCEGHGMCEQTAPELIRLDDDAVPRVADPVPPELEGQAEQAVRACPVAALRITP
jgi:ferredoxin